MSGGRRWPGGDTRQGPDLPGSGTPRENLRERGEKLKGGFKLLAELALGSEARVVGHLGRIATDAVEQHRADRVRRGLPAEGEPFLELEEPGEGELEGEVIDTTGELVIEAEPPPPQVPRGGRRCYVEPGGAGWVCCQCMTRAPARAKFCGDCGHPCCASSPPAAPSGSATPRLPR